MEKAKIFFSEGVVFADANKQTKGLYDKSRYGELKKKFYYSLFEAAYLIESKKVDVLDGKNKPILFDNFVKKAKKYDKNFLIRYTVFKDMRSRGYVVKTALKFGADFRVYDRGIKPGQDHAKWVLYPVSESEVSTWYDFSAKNRVAHSTKKRLLIGIVDNELDVTYYEINWIRP
tara:strand:- start:1694 stop:2215 length:522 start_codon:yes stop_codon:yes gene_type:complete